MEVSWQAENTSGQGKSAKIPHGVRGWSWGALLLNWIWALGNRTWIGLLALVPYVGLVVAVILGLKGREWAWRNKRWESVSHFKKVQRRWDLWAVGITVFVFVAGTLAAIILPSVLLGRGGIPTVRPSEQILTWVTEDLERDTFALSEIAGLNEWTELYVLGPYMTQDEIEEIMGTSWSSRIRPDLEGRDDINLAVFAFGPNSRYSETWPRREFDCDAQMVGKALTPATIIAVDRASNPPMLTIAEPDASPEPPPRAASSEAHD